MEKVVLTKEKETLLIPLYGKAMDAEEKPGILGDQKARAIVEQIDYDFASLHIQQKTNRMLCMRAAMLDAIISEKLEAADSAVVLHLGCGLDSRYERIRPKFTRWYDVDFPEVIELRKNFYSDTEEYHQIGSSVTEEKWLEQIKADGKSDVIVVAEGLVMYLSEEEIKTLVGRIRQRFGTFDLVMDVYSRLTAKSVSRHPSLKKTGVKSFWGMDDPGLPESWGLGMHHVATHHFTQFRLEHLSPGERAIFRLAGRFAAAKMAHRIEEYRVEKP